MTSGFLDIAAAKLVLGLLYAEVVPEIGTRALVEGYDSPALRVVAGLIEAQSDEAIPLFKQALSELTWPLPNQREAVLLLARELAAQVLRGELSPYQGAKKIWWLTREADEVGHELDPFIYAASEWEDRPEDRPLFERAIMEEAKALVDDD